MLFEVYYLVIYPFFPVQWHYPNPELFLMWLLLLFNYFSTGKNLSVSGKASREISQQPLYDVKSNALITSQDKANTKTGK